jgi:hypothetical protein
MAIGMKGGAPASRSSTPLRQRGAKQPVFLLPIDVSGVIESTRWLLRYKVNMLEIRHWTIFSKMQFISWVLVYGR